MKLTQEQLTKLCETAKEAACEAGQFIQSQFDQDYETKGKVGGDSFASQVVTEVDFKAQEIILNHLNASIQEFDLGLLTEESVDDNSRLEKDYFWCVDPMDGTLPFTERRTGYAVSIALVAREGFPVIGVVYIPDLDQCYCSIKGAGVSLNEEQMELVGAANQTTLHWYMDRSFQSEPYYQQVVNQMMQHFNTQEVVIHADFGGVRNAIGVIASGNGCYFKFSKKRNGCGSIWDYAATRLFFEELGLHVTNSRGDELHLNDSSSTFMNTQGIVYSTDSNLFQLIKEVESLTEQVG